MRLILLSFAFALTALAHASAGQLTVAIIQYGQLKTIEDLNAAFAGQKLYEVTDSNRTISKVSDLKAGDVLFAQTIAASSGSPFASTTRLNNNRADVEGKLSDGRISVTVDLSEGIKAGLRNFQKRVYTGSGSLSGGSPVILSMRQIHGKSPSITKNQVKMDSFDLTIVLVAQYTP